MPEEGRVRAAAAEAIGETLMFCALEVSRTELSQTDADGESMISPVALLYLRLEGGNGSISAEDELYVLGQEHRMA